MIRRKLFAFLGGFAAAVGLPAARVAQATTQVSPVLPEPTQPTQPVLLFRFAVKTPSEIYYVPAPAYVSGHREDGAIAMAVDPLPGVPVGTILPTVATTAPRGFQIFDTIEEAVAFAAKVCGVSD